MREDVAHKGSRRSEHRGGRSRHHGREHGAKEKHAEPERHVVTNERRQQALRIGGEHVLRAAGHYQNGGDDDEHRHKRKEDVDAAADDGAGHGRLHVSGGHDALEDVLLRNRADHHRDGGGYPKEPPGRRRLRKRIEEIALMSVVDHLAETAREIRRKKEDRNEAEHDDDHLHEVGDCDGPHAAVHRVGKHNDGADHHAARHGDVALGDQVDHETERSDLSPHPPEVGEDDEKRAENLDAAAVALAVVVADRQDVELVELLCEEHAHKNQSHAGAERLFDHTYNAALDEAAGKTQNGFGTKPGGKRCRDDHRQRKTAPCKGKITRTAHTRCGIEADGDRRQHVEHYKTNQRHLTYFLIKRR